MGQKEYEQSFYGLVTLVILIIILIPIYYFFLSRIREVILKKIKSLMHQNVDQNNLDFDSSNNLKEVPAKNNLTFLEINSESHLLEAVNTASNKKVSRIRSKYQKRLLFQIILVIIYFLIAFKIADILFKHYELINVDTRKGYNPIDFQRLRENANEIWATVEILELVNYIILVLKILFVWLLLKYLGAYYLFSVYKNKVLNTLKPLWSIISYLFVSKMGFPLYFIFTLFVVRFFIGVTLVFNLIPESVDIYILLFLVINISHIIILHRFVITSRNQPNLKLQILRVFGQHSLSKNLFTKLGKYWSMFGTYFTVVDNSFYQIYWKKKYNSNIGIYIFITISLVIGITQFGMKFESQLGEVLSIFIAFLAFSSFFVPIIFIYRFNIRKIGLDIISNESKLNERLKKLQLFPKGINDSFKEAPLLCYNNTWRMAVDNLCEYSDVILMDLRGYSTSNKGCEYEVNFLFDRVLLNKIVFITDVESVELIQQLLIRQWEFLIETSPNLNLQEPKALIYISKQRNETKKETQGVLDTLLYYAIRNCG